MGALKWTFTFKVSLSSAKPTPAAYTVPLGSNFQAKTIVNRLT